MAGGSNIPLSVVDPNQLVSDVQYPLSILVFKDDNNDVENFPRTGGYYISQMTTSDLSKFTAGYSVLIPTDLNSGKTLLMCYIEGRPGNEKTRTPFFIYVDEFDRYSSGLLSDMIVIYRKFKVGTIFAIPNLVCNTCLLINIIALLLIVFITYFF